MVELLTPSDFNAVRWAIDTKLNEKILPDETIESKIYAQSAISEVVARVGDISALTVEQFEKANTATILICAALLVPATIQITSLSVTTRDISYSKPAWNPDEKIAELRDKANEQINDILQNTDRKYTAFVSVAGGRG